MNKKVIIVDRLLFNNNITKDEAIILLSGTDYNGIKYLNDLPFNPFLSRN